VHSASECSGTPSSTNAPCVSTKVSERQPEHLKSLWIEPGAAVLPALAGLTRLSLKSTGVTESGVLSLFALTSECRSSLQMLDLSGCGRVNLSSLRHVPPQSLLHTLRADRCMGIMHLSLAFPQASALKSVSLCECLNCLSLQLTAPALQRLALQACKMLQSVSLTTPALRHLCAPQCASLTTLELHGPAGKLTSLNLVGCTQLPSAALHQALAKASQLLECNVSACKQLGALVVPGSAPTCVRKSSPWDMLACACPYCCFVAHDCVSEFAAMPIQLTLLYPQHRVLAAGLMCLPSCEPGIVLPSAHVCGAGSYEACCSLQRVVHWYVYKLERQA
jgi:hypothetical protein